jgi:hypothetical protein
VNCRHSFFFVFLGITEPTYTKEELKSYDAKEIEYNGKKMSVYEAEQKMRTFERNIRSWKRQANALEAGGLDNSFEKQKIKEWNKRYKDFAEKTEINKQNNRLAIYNNNRKSARKKIVKS